MQRLRRLSLAVVAAVCLGGLPACGSDDVEREANQAGEKVDKATDEAKRKAEEAKRKAEEAKRKAEEAKKDVDGY